MKISNALSIVTLDGRPYKFAPLTVTALLVLTAPTVATVVLESHKESVKKSWIEAGSSYDDAGLPWAIVDVPTHEILGKGHHPFPCEKPTDEKCDCAWCCDKPDAPPPAKEKLNPIDDKFDKWLESLFSPRPTRLGTELTAAVPASSPTDDSEFRHLVSELEKVFGVSGAGVAESIFATPRKSTVPPPTTTVTKIRLTVKGSDPIVLPLASGREDALEICRKLENSVESACRAAESRTLTKIADILFG